MQKFKFESSTCRQHGEKTTSACRTRRNESSNDHNNYNNGSNCHQFSCDRVSRRHCESADAKAEAHSSSNGPKPLDSSAFFISRRLPTVSQLNVSRTSQDAVTTRNLVRLANYRILCVLQLMEHAQCRREIFLNLYLFTTILQGFNVVKQEKFGKGQDKEVFCLDEKGILESSSVCGFNNVFSPTSATCNAPLDPGTADWECGTPGAPSWLNIWARQEDYCLNLCVGEKCRVAKGSQAADKTEHRTSAVSVVLMMAPRTSTSNGLVLLLGVRREWREASLLSLPSMRPTMPPGVLIKPG